MDMNIEMDKNTATDSITSRLADARNDLGITQKDLAIISSIDTPKTAANTTRLSRVGIATPCCHLYTACGVANPNISARSFTERPALILSLAISIVGIVIIFPPVPAVSQHLPNSRAVQAVLL
jgi:putative transcriptional regulator